MYVIAVLLEKFVSPVESFVSISISHSLSSIFFFLLYFILFIDNHLGQLCGYMCLCIHVRLCTNVYESLCLACCMYLCIVLIGLVPSSFFHRLQTKAIVRGVRFTNMSSIMRLVRSLKVHRYSIAILKCIVPIASGKYRTAV